MSAGLVLTAFVAWFTWQNTALQASVLSVGLLPIILLQFGLVMAISFLINRISAPVAGILFALYAAVNGLTLSSIFLLYAPSSITAAFISSAAMFGAMSVVGYTTKTDLTRMGNLMFMALIGLIVAMIVNMFLHSGPLGFIISAVGVVIFTALTAYDTQKLKVMALSSGSALQSDVGEKMAVYGALTLYLDFINLFLMLLRLFSGGGNRN
jgi:uncharacterized protein